MELRVRDVTKLFAVTEKKIYEWIDDKGLPTSKVNGQYCFNRAELLEWAAARQIPLSGKILGEPENGAAALPGFADALEAGGVHHGVGGADRESALRAIVSLMPLADDADRDFLLDVFLAREALGSTGIGDGIAIPHVRNPVVAQVPKAMITLNFLATPIDFGALDGKPVHALFSLISPSVRAHLHLLSRIAFTLHDARFKKAVMRQAPAREILEEARRVERDLAARSPGAAREQ